MTSTGRPLLSAHPRSRGENDPTRAPAWWGLGSSPLTRGKRSVGRSRRRRRWLIPAHAGKTLRACTWWCSWWAHPRSRGENARSRGLRLSRLGSSPLTRGKRCSGDTVPDHGRAHPRSRGENKDGLVHADDVAGSSPLTRGKRLQACAVDGRPGLIPAHAGKTSFATATTAGTEAHPRSRGENKGSCMTAHVCQGSSPLTRGKPITWTRPTNCSRLIPAHAGKTQTMGTGLARSRAHPRSRGENGSVLSFYAGGGGSSPLTRGKRRGRPSSHSTPGLIPAHAGKT